MSAGCPRCARYAHGDATMRSARSIAGEGGSSRRAAGRRGWTVAAPAAPGAISEQVKVDRADPKKSVNMEPYVEPDEEQT